MNVPLPLLRNANLLAAALLLAACGSPSGDGSNEENNATETNASSGAGSGSPSPASLPTHAALLPEDAWLVATIRPGQLMEKLDYHGFIHTPAIGFLRSTANPGFDYDFGDEDPRQRENLVRLTRLLEDPAHTGLNLSQAAYLHLGPPSGKPGPGSFLPPLPTLGLVLPLADRENFENLVEWLLRAAEEEDVSRSTRQGVRLLRHEHWLLAITDTHARFLFTAVENTLDLDAFLAAAKKPKPLPPALAAHLARPFDAGLFLDYKGYAEYARMLIDLTHPGGSTLETTFVETLLGYTENATVATEFTAENGKLQLLSRANYGKDSPFTELAGQGAPDNLLDLLPASSIALGSASINVAGLRKALEELSDELADARELAELPGFSEVIPELGLSPAQILSAFSGDLSAALIDLPDPDTEPPFDDLPEFVLALGTVDSASEVYQQILKNKLLLLFEQAARPAFEQIGLSLVAKDNRLILASRGQAQLLRDGKAAQPVAGQTRERLAQGYFNVTLNFAKLAAALPFDPQDADEEERLVLEGFQLLESAEIRSTQQGADFETTLTLTLADKQTNALRQIAQFIANALDPAWHDPEVRPRILAARKLAQEQPDLFRKRLVGSWKNEWTDEVDNASRSISKYTYHADGAHAYEFLYVPNPNAPPSGGEEAAPSHERFEGSWKVVGATLLTYDEHGLLEWVGGILDLNDKRFEYYNVGAEYDFPEEYEISTDERVPDDWRLPEPPPGLPKPEE